MKRVSQLKISMPNPELKIQCSNSHCLAYNAVERNFCKRCKTPVIKRYLWAIEPIALPEKTPTEIEEEDPSKRLICDRYFTVTDRIVLDTKPGLLPQIPEELPKAIITYLKLFSCHPHIPQVYGQLEGTDIWLLDYGTVPLEPSGRLIYPQLIPEIDFLWAEATPQKQLNWLLQIANLWQPLYSRGVASTLLNPFFLRINGSLLQILQLETDGEIKPTLQDLGTFWAKLIPTASPIIQEILTQICWRLENRTIEEIDQVILLLNRALEITSQLQEYSYEIFASSDSGPSRDNNEDAAYPLGNTPKTILQDGNSLAIVCDGVGGHDGGEIASQETIKYLQSRISKLPFEQAQTNPEKILKKLTKYINEANDAINKRNDSEQRQERQRMGTTLVMTLVRNHEVYLTHVGDSRIYWISNTGCHQITVDDDLASREVRLGYAVYRDALQYPSAGALIQALGMRDSTALHPNVKRLVIDDNCIFLLCSDGLSDFDRVEQYWRSLILPILNDKGDITKAVRRFIKLANERNGHDNVTIALVHCQVKPKPGAFNTPIPWSRVESVIEESFLWSEVNLTDDLLPHTQAVPPEPEINLEPNAVIKKSRFPRINIIILGLILLVSLSLLLYYKKYKKNEPPQQQNSLAILTPKFDSYSAF